MPKIKPHKSLEPDFGHAPGTLAFWRRLVREALTLANSTPLYVFSGIPVAESLAELDAALMKAGFVPADGQSFNSQIGFRHCLSCKTQPAAPLLRWWQRQGRPIEVVSEFELRAALAAGFPAERILVNGPAKNHWLPFCKLRDLSVHFDSPAELNALLATAKKMNWRCGVRINTAQEFDPEQPMFPTQFGFSSAEAVTALKKLMRARVRLESVHFHLRSNIASPQAYRLAIAEVAEICRAAKFQPRILDVGGGIPVRHVRTRGGKPLDAEFSLAAFANVLRHSLKAFPNLQEVWLENGRFLTTGSGVLVVKILDTKTRRGVRQLICDGGRTMNALLSVWEQHKLLPLANRSGARVLTVVHGPTCMAFDQLARRPFPRSLKTGDHLLWLDAGAYHLPWETRFSHGHAAVVWQDEQGLHLARERESFAHYWEPWLG